VKEWLKSVLNYQSYPKNKTGYPFFWNTLYTKIWRQHNVTCRKTIQFFYRCNTWFFLNIPWKFCVNVNMSGVFFSERSVCTYSGVKMYDKIFCHTCVEYWIVWKNTFTGHLAINLKWCLSKILGYVEYVATSVTVPCKILLPASIGLLDLSASNTR